MSDSKKTGVREGKSRLAESKWMVDACHLVFGGKICSICLHKRVVLGMQVAGLARLQERIVTVPSGRGMSRSSMKMKGVISGMLEVRV